MKISKKTTLAGIITFSILITGCSSDKSTDDEKKNISQNDLSFNDFCDEVFVEMASIDALTLNYLISDITSFGIEKYPEVMIDFDSTDIEMDMDEVDELRTTLEGYDYNSLSFDQQVTYDTLTFYLDCCELSEGLALYSEPLGATIGFQAQLPTTLAEYTFYTKEDIDRYLTALPSVYDLFDEIMKFEENKSKAGLFMSDTNAQAVIDQCTEFISKTDDNYLITSFNEEIDSYEGLTDDERESYKEKNADIVLNKIIPAYQLMIDRLEELKTTGSNTGGLCNFERGKEYYEYLMRSNVGTDKSVDEIKSALEDKIRNEIYQLYMYSAFDSDYFTKLTNAEIDTMSPDDILTALYEASKNEFPDIGTITYTLKDVDASLEDYISPAMYFKPPVDLNTVNTIFINKAQLDDNLQTFVTIAHEGIPGHMYQFNYIKDNENYPIRQALDITGVSEGWAKYVEYKSYNYIDGLESAVANGLAINSEIALCVEAVAEIGVNYEGWSVQDVYDYTTDYFSIDMDVAEQIYQSAIEMPSNIVCYAYGAIVYENMEDEAITAKGEDYDAVEFNKFLLDTGLAPFPVIEDRFENYYLAG